MDLSSSLSSSHLHEVIFSDRHYINKLEQMITFLQYIEKSITIPNQNIFMLIRPRGFGLSLATEGIESIVSRDDLLIDHINNLMPNLSFDGVIHHPVVRISFNHFKAANCDEFVEEISTLLQRQMWEHHIKNRNAHNMDLRSLFSTLLREIAQTEQSSVVVLIDNYDIPIHIIRYMKNKQEREDAMTAYLDMLYAIRQVGMDVKFCLLTGHSKFALSSYASEGLAHVLDLSYSEQTATLLGFTIDEIKECYKEDLMRVAPQQGVTVSEYLQALDRCYGGFCFSDSMKKVLRPYSVSRALDNDGCLLPYAQDSDYPFLTTVYEEEEPDLNWFINKDGQDALFLEKISLEPKGKEFGSLLLQLGFFSINKVTFSDQEHSMSWRYRFALTNIEMQRVFKVITKQASRELQEQAINPQVFEDGENNFDINEEE